MKYFFANGLLIALLFSSCTTINKSHMNSSLDIKLESDMGAKIDVDLTRKLVGYASGGYLFHFMRISGDNKYIDGVSYNGAGDGWWTSKVESVKAAAAYNAVKTSDADVLISPQYVVEENHWNPFYKQIKVKVVGYAGKMVSIKNKN